jgi:hypothetical protein
MATGRGANPLDAHAAVRVGRQPDRAGGRRSHSQLVALT